MSDINAEVFFREFEKKISTFHFNPVENDVLASASNLIGDFVNNGGDINLLCPNAFVPTPVWLSMLLAIERSSFGDEPELVQGKLMAALEHMKTLGNIQYKRYRNRSTAFYTAIWNSCFRTATLIIEDGLDLSLETRPTILAAVSKFTFHKSDESELLLVKSLLKAGESPNLGDKDGVYHPLSMACDKSLVGCSRILIESGADVNLADKYGATPIMHAIGNVLSGDGDHAGRANQKEMTELLLVHGAHVNARTSQNRTFHSMVKNHCTPELQEIIFKLVKDHLGEQALRPTRNVKTKKEYDVYLNDSQLSIKRFEVDHKRSQIEWILSCFKDNGVEEFEPGHITAAYKALNIDAYGEGSPVKCPKAEAQKNLNKIIRQKTFPIELVGDVYRILL